MPRFTGLKAWQKAHELVLAVYRLTAGLPREEQFGLVSQMRRAAVSVAANLAEGRERGSDADFARFLTLATGSLSELQYYFVLVRDLGYCADAEVQPPADLAAECMRVTRALRDGLNADR